MKYASRAPESKPVKKVAKVAEVADLATLVRRIQPRHLDMAAGKSGLSTMERRALMEAIRT